MMTRFLSRLLLILTVTLATPPHVDRAIHVVLVEPAGESYDPGRAAQARAAVGDAAAFWHNQATLTIVSTTVISPAGDVYADLSWSLSMLQPAAADVTIFVFDNQVSDARLPGGDVGAAQDFYGAIWATQHGDLLPAVLAHELGHVLFGLPDWYRTPGACTQIDIMCGHLAAYQRGVIGCQSLAVLGTPCRRVSIPLVQR